MMGTEGKRTAKRRAALRLRLPGPRRWAAWALQGALMAALTGSRLLGDLSPFSAALCAAGLARSWSVVAMSAGCGVFGLLAGWPTQALAALAGCAVAAVAEGVARRVAGPRLNALRDGLTGLTACAAVLLPGLILSHGLRFNLMAAALSACLAALLAPALSGALSISPRRRRLLPDEQLSCAILAVTLITGLGGFPYGGQQLAETAAVLFTLLAASRGPGAGAAGGIACGAALALGSGVAPAGSALGLCGLLAGCARSLPRPAAALALALGNALAVTAGLGFALGGVGLIPLLAGGGLYCAIPRKWLRRIGRLMESQSPELDPARLALCLRRDAGERLGRLQQAFDAAARCWTDEEPAPDEAALVNRMREALCAGCADYARCWQGDHPEAGRLMCRLLSEAVCRGDAPPVGERPPELVRHCRRSAQMDRRLQPMLATLARDQRLRRQRESLRSVAARQAACAAKALDMAGKELLAPPALDPELARIAAAALDRAGCPAKQVVVSTAGTIRVWAAPAHGEWRKADATRAGAALSEALGVRLFPRALPGECLFTAAPSFTARAGYARLPAGPDAPCGDAVYVGALPDGRLMAVLSDGMGSGPRAADESRRTVELLRTFLEAGYDSADALESVNALLQTRAGGELFATVDLCVIDLNTGEACLSKLGACSSLLITGGEAKRIEGGRLPIGILDSVTPGQRRLTLRPGDTLVLYSDGVADDLREEDAAWLAEAALSAAHQPPADMARALCAAARAHSTHPDDRSAAVIQLALPRLA